MGKWMVTAVESNTYELEVEANSYEEAVAEMERTAAEAWDELVHTETEFYVTEAEEI